MNTTTPVDDGFVIAGRTYRSRLLTGTGKFKDLDETRLATEAAGAEIVTVAIRRSNIGQNPGEPNLLDDASWGDGATPEVVFNSLVAVPVETCPEYA